MSIEREAERKVGDTSAILISWRRQTQLWWLIEYQLASMHGIPALDSYIVWLLQKYAGVSIRRLSLINNLTNYPKANKDRNYLLERFKMPARGQGCPEARFWIVRFPC